MTELDSLWDFGDPAASEKRFAEWLQQPGLTNDHLAQGMSQLARTHSLRRQFDEAHEILDRAEALATLPLSHGRVTLERGRCHNSAGDKNKAGVAFAQAVELFRQAGDEGLEIDAMHMAAIAASTEESIELNRTALERARASRDPRAQKWVGSLLNNLGWSLMDLGRPEEALEAFKEALDFRIQQGQRIPEARWAVARALREIGQVDEAIRLQTENLQQGEDPYVDEELALLYQQKMKMHAQASVTHFEQDDTFPPDRLQVLRVLAQ